MYGWHSPMISGVSGAAWIVIVATLVIIALAAIRNVARLRFFGGRGESNLEPSELFKLNSAVDVALACFDSLARNGKAPGRKPNLGAPTLALIHRGGRFRVPASDMALLRHSAMHRRQVECIQLDMNGMEQSYTALLNEYRMALGVWSEARAIYSADEPEVAAATNHLEALEEELASYSQPAALAA